MLNKYSVRTRSAVHYYVSAVAAAGMLLVACDGGSQQPGAPACLPNATDCYTADGQRVDLEWSPGYETATFSSAPSDADLEELTRGIEGAANPIGIVRRHPLLDEFGIVLIELYDGVSPDRVRDALANLQLTDPNKRAFPGRDAIGGGNPVYRNGAANFVMVNQLTVRFRSDVDAATKQTYLDTLASQNPGMQIVRDAGRRNWYVLRFPALTAQQTLALANRLNSDPIVEFSEPDFVSFGGPASPRAGGPAAPGAVCPIGPSTPATDPLFAKQWYLANDGTTGSADVNATRAWPLLDGSQNDVVVAIIDTGVQSAHEDLAGRVLVGMGYDATNNPKTPLGEPGTHEQDAHGTAVAGLVAAIAGNTHGIKGLGAGVKIVSIRVLYYYQPGSAATATWAASQSWFADGIEEGAEVADVLNNSWSTDNIPPTTIMTSAIDYAIGLRRAVVFAAGNQFAAPTPVSYPALLSKSKPILAVGASNQFDQIRAWGAEGLVGPPWGSTRGEGLSMVAPGTNMVTTDLMGSAGYCNTGNYAVFWGTSAAAPLVSAAAALIIAKNAVMIAKNPGALPQFVRDKLTSSAVHPTPTTRPTSELGWGRLDVCRALDGEAACLESTPEAPTNIVVW